MNKMKSVVIAAVGLLGLASACSLESGDMPSEYVESGEDAACGNEEGINAAMASLAVATAMDLRRWLPARDFRINSSTGRLEISSYGYPRCADNRQCRNTQAILDWQKPEYAGKVKFPGGAVLNPSTFAERLRTFYDRQMTCNNRVDNHTGDDCPVEYHDLTFNYTVKSSCGSDYWFKARKQGDPNTLLQYPHQLKNQLIWVGYNKEAAHSNPYLAFDSQGDDVKIDPTVGATAGDPSASGSCPVVCNKFSTTNITGQCCVCNGATRTLSLGGSNPYMFACQ